MACLAFQFPRVAIPGLYILVPLLPRIPLPADFTFCCKFEIPDILGINAATAIINAALSALGGEVNSIAAMAQAEIEAALDPILNLAVSVSLECPIDGTIG